MLVFERIVYWVFHLTFNLYFSSFWLQLNEELIRLSITWVELWFESLEDASRVYFGEKDIGKMFRLLHPLHQMMDRGHETIHEATFLQEHGGDLANCRVCCETFERTGARIVLQQAWDRYYMLYRRVSTCCRFALNTIVKLRIKDSFVSLHVFSEVLSGLSAFRKSNGSVWLTNL